MIGLASLRRELDWQIRHRLTWSAPVRKRRMEPRAVFAAGLPDAAGARYGELDRLYPLSRWEPACTTDEFLESLCLLDLLDRYLPSPPAGNSLDIGCKNWSYLPALHAWRPGPWDGVELDAHVRYFDLSTRRGRGEEMARSFPGCRYRACSLLDVRESYDLVTWFLPFVTPGPQLAWGLPQRFFAPAALLHHAWSRLLPGGILFVLNQNGDEALVQGRLLEECGIGAEGLGEISGPFREDEQRHGWVARKPCR